MKKDNISRIISLYVLTAFAFLALFLKSSVIFDWFGIWAMNDLGFSNYSNIELANRAKFSMASFELDSDASVSVIIIYE